MTADLIAFLRERYSELVGTCDWVIEAQRLLNELEMYYITGEEQHPLYDAPDWQVALGRPGLCRPPGLLRGVAAVIYRLLRDIIDGFWNGVDYIWLCRWMP